MKASTMTAKLLDLWITASHSRPRVSNDNPYSEALFRTCKYRPQTQWDQVVTPSELHNGEDNAILKRRSDVYQKAAEDNPKR